MSCVLALDSSQCPRLELRWKYNFDDIRCIHRVMLITACESCELWKSRHFLIRHQNIKIYVYLTGVFILHQRGFKLFYTKTYSSKINLHKSEVDSHENIYDGKFIKNKSAWRNFCKTYFLEFNWEEERLLFQDWLYFQPTTLTSHYLLMEQNIHQKILIHFPVNSSKVISVHAWTHWDQEPGLQDKRMGEGEEERPPEFDSILEMTGLDPDQVELNPSSNIVWNLFFTVNLPVPSLHQNCWLYFIKCCHYCSTVLYVLW